MFIESLKASSKSLRNSCNSSKRHAEGASARATAAAAAGESAAQKDAAEKAKTEVDRKAKEVPATYASRNMFPPVPTSPTFVGDWDLSKPCLFLQASVEGLQEFKQDPVAKLMLASFGGSHKKTASFTETKMYNCPLYTGKGLEAVNTWIANGPLKQGPANLYNKAMLGSCLGPLVAIK